MRGLIAALGAVFVIAAAPAAQADVQPYAANDAGGFHDVLPPGANGTANGVELAAFLTTGARPAHNDDQLAMYRDLVYATPGLKAQDLGRYYKDATFGVQAGRRRAHLHPARRRDDPARQRLRRAAHLRRPRAPARCSAPATPPREDRLFFIDVLRHARPRAALLVRRRRRQPRPWTPSSGRSPPTPRPTSSASSTTPTTSTAPQGASSRTTSPNYVAGVNQYIAEARLDPTKMPGEYAAIGRRRARRLEGDRPLRHRLARRRDLRQGRRRASWPSRRLLRRVQAPLRRRGRAARCGSEFRGLRRPRRADHGAGQALPLPGQAGAGGRRGAARPRLVQGPARRTLAGRPARGRRPAAGGNRPLPPRPRAGVPPLPGLPLPESARCPRRCPTRCSSRARKSASGHPLAVFGPQVAYFAPQILMEEDLHGAGHRRASGAAFPGVNLYVQLGHGRDYAWSATSAGQDIIDTFAVPLCERRHADVTRLLPLPRPVPADRGARAQRTRGPRTSADSTPAGSETLHAERTEARARRRARHRTTASRSPTPCCARPTSTRSTRRSASPSSTTPARSRRPRTSSARPANIGYTFNWFYVDAKHIAYFNSGNNPVRAKGDDRPAPDGARPSEWRDFDPDLNTARYTPPAQHPQVDRPAVLTSWNNRQAPGYAGADSNLFSSVYRSQMLDRQLALRLKGGHKLTLPEMVDAMEQAGTTDLRGMTALPLALRVLGHAEGPGAGRGGGQAEGMVGRRRPPHRPQPRRRLRQRRRGADHGRLVAAAHRRDVLAGHGPPPARHLEATYQIDNEPNNHGDHLGSAYQEGFYGYVSRTSSACCAARSSRGTRVAFCGHGELAACRKALESSLKRALGEKATDTYPADAVCTAGDQPCLDDVRFRPLGGVTQPLIPWINRPTYQQAVEVQGRSPR